MELNPVNVRLMRKILGGSKYELNIIQGNTLSEDKQCEMLKLLAASKQNDKKGGKKKTEKCTVNDNVKFDLVMGNPPFQKSQNRTNRGGVKLWDKFVTISLDKFIQKDGLLSFIHPPPWRKPENKLWPIMSNRQIFYLNMNSENNGNKLFSSATKYDWYVLKNSENINTRTKIVDEHRQTMKLNLKNWPFLPNGNYELFTKMFDFNKKDTFDVIYNSDYDSRHKHMQKSKSQNNIHPVIYTINSESTETWYSNKRYDTHFRPKVMLSMGRYIYPTLDALGDYGMSQIVFGLPIKSKQEGEQIIRGLNSEQFQAIVKDTKWGSFNTEWKMFNYLKRDFYKYLDNYKNKNKGGARKNQKLQKGESLKQKPGNWFFNWLFGPNRI